MIVYNAWNAAPAFTVSIAYDLPAVFNNTSETGSPNVPTVAPEQDQSAASPSPVDLLDDAETGNLSNANNSSEMQDLD
jgi:hypothetical protein